MPVLTRPVSERSVPERWHLLCHWCARSISMSMSHRLHGFDMRYARRRVRLSSVPEQRRVRTVSAQLLLMPMPTRIHWHQLRDLIERVCIPAVSVRWHMSRASHCLSVSMSARLQRHELSIQYQLLFVSTVPERRRVHHAHAQLAHMSMLARNNGLVLRDCD